MKFGGLSAKEVDKITELLTRYNVSHNVITDEAMMNSNEESMQYNLRHLNSPNISTHVLAIEIDSKDFENMHEDLKSNLLDFGITNEIPDELELTAETETVQAELNKGNKRLVGHGMLHQIIASVIFLVLYLMWLKYSN